VEQIYKIGVELVPLNVEASLSQIEKDIKKAQRESKKLQKEYERGLKATAKAFEGKLTPRIDESTLYALNDHLDLKQKHWKETKQDFSDPLKPKVDQTELDSLNHTLSAIKQLGDIKVKVAAQNPGVTINNLKITLDVGGLEGAVYRGVRSAQRADRPNVAQKVGGFAMRVAGAPVRLAASAFTGVTRDIVRGFTESLGKSVAEGTFANRTVKRTARKATLTTGRVASDIVGTDDVVSTFLAELIDTGKVVKSAKAAAQKTNIAKASQNIQKLSALASGSSAGAETNLKKEDPDLYKRVKQRQLEIFNRPGYDRSVKVTAAEREKAAKEGKEITPQQRSRPAGKEFALALAETIDELQQGDREIKGLIQSIIVQTETYHKLVGKIQSKRAVKHSARRAEDFAPVFPVKQQNGQDYESYMLSYGGAQRADGHGGRRLSTYQQALFPNSRVIPVENPDTDYKSEQVAGLSPVTQKLYAWADYLISRFGGGNQGSINTAQNASRQVVQGFDPFFLSKAVVDGLAQMEAGAKHGVGADRFGATSYSMGGAELIRLNRALQEKFGEENQKVPMLAQAYPYVNMADERLPNFQATIARQDSLATPLNLGVAKQSENLKILTDVPVTGQGTEAHSDKHLFKSQQHREAMFKAFGDLGMTDIRNDSGATGSFINELGSKLFETLVAIGHTQSLATTGKPDVAIGLGGTDIENSAAAIARFFETKQTIEKATPTDNPEFEAIKQLTKNKIDEVVPLIVEALRARGAEISDAPTDKEIFGLTKAIEQISSGRNAEIDSLITGKKDPKAYFAGNLDPTLVKARLSDAKPALNFFAQQEKGNTHIKAIADLFRELIPAMEEFGEKGKLSEETKAKLESVKLKTRTTPELEEFLSQGIDRHKPVFESKYKPQEGEVPKFTEEVPAAITIYNKLLKDLHADGKKIIPAMEEFKKVAYGHTGAATLLTDKYAYKADFGDNRRIGSEDEMAAHKQLQGRYSPIAVAGKDQKYMVTERVEGAPAKDLITKAARPIRGINKKLAENKTALSAEGLLDEDRTKLENTRTLLQKQKKEFQARFNAVSESVFSGLGSLLKVLQNFDVVHNDMHPNNAFVKPEVFKQMVKAIESKTQEEFEKYLVALTANELVAIDFGRSKVSKDTHERKLDLKTSQSRATSDTSFADVSTSYGKKASQYIQQGYNKALPTQLAQPRELEKPVQFPDVAPIVTGSAGPDIMQATIGDWRQLAQEIRASQNALKNSPLAKLNVPQKEHVEATSRSTETLKSLAQVAIDTTTALGHLGKAALDKADLSTKVVAAAAGAGVPTSKEDLLTSLNYILKHSKYGGNQPGDAAATQMESLEELKNPLMLARVMGSMARYTGHAVEDTKNNLGEPFVGAAGNVFGPAARTLERFQKDLEDTHPVLALLVKTGLGVAVPTAAMTGVSAINPAAGAAMHAVAEQLISYVGEIEGVVSGFVSGSAASHLPGWLINLAEGGTKAGQSLSWLVQKIPGVKEALSQMGVGISELTTTTVAGKLLLKGASDTAKTLVPTNVKEAAEAGQGKLSARVAKKITATADLPALLPGQEVTSDKRYVQQRLQGISGALTRMTEAAIEAKTAGQTELSQYLAKSAQYIQGKGTYESRDLKKSTQLRGGAATSYKAFNENIEARGARLQNEFGDIASFATKGLLEGNPEMEAAAKQLGGKVWAAVEEAKRVLGIHSPSKEFQTIANFAAEGVKTGRMSMEKAARYLASGLEEALQKSSAEDVGGGWGDDLLAGLIASVQRGDLSSIQTSLEAATKRSVKAGPNLNAPPPPRYGAASMQHGGNIPDPWDTPIEPRPAPIIGKQGNFNAWDTPQYEAASMQHAEYTGYAGEFRNTSNKTTQQTAALKVPPLEKMLQGLFPSQATKKKSQEAYKLGVDFGNQFVAGTEQFSGQIGGPILQFLSQLASTGASGVEGFVDVVSGRLNKLKEYKALPILLLAGFSIASIGAGKEIENLQRQLAGVGIVGKKAFAEVYDSAQRNKIDVLQAGQTAAQIKGSLLGTSSEEDAGVFTEKLNKLQKVKSLPPETYERFQRAFTQMMSKGTVQMEELKGQMAEAVPESIPAMAQALGVSNQKLQSMIGTGSVQSAVVAEPFLDQMISNAGTGQLETLDQKLVVTSNAMKMLQAEASKPAMGLFKVVVDAAGWVLDKLAKNAGLFQPIFSGAMVLAAGSAIMLAGRIGLVTASLKLAGGAVVAAFTNPLLLALAAVAAGVSAFTSTVNTETASALDGMNKGLEEAIKNAKELAGSLPGNTLPEDLSKGKAEERYKSGKRTGGVKKGDLTEQTIEGGLDSIRYFGSVLLAKSADIDKFIDSGTGKVTKEIENATPAERQRVEKFIQSRNLTPTTWLSGGQRQRNTEQIDKYVEQTAPIAAKAVNLKQNLAPYAVIKRQIEEQQANVAGLSAAAPGQVADSTLKAEQQKLRKLKDEAKAIFANATGVDTAGNIDENLRAVNAQLANKANLSQKDIDALEKQKQLWEDISDEVKALASVNLQALDNARNQGNRQQADADIDSSYQRRLAALAGVRAKFALNNEQAAKQEAAAEIDSTKAKLGALDDFISKQKSILSSSPTRIGLEGLLGKSIDSANLGDISAAEVQIQSNPQADVLKPDLDILKQIKSAENERAAAINNSAQAQLRAVQAQVSYLASLHSISDELERLNNIEQARSTITDANNTRKVNAVKAQSGQIGKRDSDLEQQTRDAELAGLRNKREDLLTAANDKKALAESLSSNDRQQANTYLGGVDISESTLYDVANALKAIASAEKDNKPVNANVKNAILARQAGLNLDEQVPQLDSQIIDNQRASQSTITVRQAQDFALSLRDKVKGLVRSADDLLLDMGDALSDAQDEMKMASLQQVLGAGRNRIYASMRGLQGPVIQLFEIIASGLEEIQGIVNEQSSKQRQLQRKPLELLRRKEDATSEFNRAKLDAYNSAQDLVGQTSPVIASFKKGSLDVSNLPSLGGFSFGAAKNTQMPKGSADPTSPLFNLGDAASATGVKFDALGGALSNSLGMIDKAVRMNQSLQQVNKSLAEVKIANTLNKKAKEMEDAVDSIITELHQLPQELGSFALSLSDFRRGPKQATISEETVRQKSEADNQFLGLVEQRRQLLKKMENLKDFSPATLSGIKDYVGQSGASANVVAGMNSMLDKAASEFAADGAANPELLAKIRMGFEKLAPSKADLQSNKANVDKVQGLKQLGADADLNSQYGQSAFTKQLAGSRFVTGTMFGEALAARAEIENMLATQASRLAQVQEQARLAGADVGLVTERFKQLEGLKLDALVDNMKTMKNALLDVVKNGIQGLGDALYSIVDGSATAADAIRGLLKSMSKQLFDVAWKNLTDNIMFKIGVKTGSTPNMPATERFTGIPQANDLFTGGKAGLAGLTPIQGALPVYIINKDPVSSASGLVPGGQGGDILTPESRALGGADLPLGVPSANIPMGRGLDKNVDKDIQFGSPPAPMLSGGVPLPPPPNVGSPIPVSVESVPPPPGGYESMWKSPIDSQQSTSLLGRGSVSEYRSSVPNNTPGTGLLISGTGTFADGIPANLGSELNAGPNGWMGLAGLAQQGSGQIKPPRDLSKRAMGLFGPRFPEDGLKSTDPYYSSPVVMNGQGRTGGYTPSNIYSPPETKLGVENAMQGILETVQGVASNTGSPVPVEMTQSSIAVLGQVFLKQESLGQVVTPATTLVGGTNLGVQANPVSTGLGLVGGLFNSVLGGTGQGIAPGTSGAIPVEVVNQPDSQNLVGSLSGLAGAAKGLLGGANSGLPSAAGAIGTALPGLASALIPQAAPAAGEAGGLLGGLGGAAGIFGMVMPLLATILGVVTRPKPKDYENINYWDADKFYGLRTQRVNTTAKGSGGVNKRKNDPWSKNKVNYDFSTGDVAGRFALGGLVGLDGQDETGQHLSAPEKLNQLLDKEGPNGRVVVASVGERILNIDETKKWAMLSKSGALDLVESDKQAHFKTGGIIGSGLGGNASAFDSAKTNRDRRVQEINNNGNVVINGVKDYDSFKRNKAAIEQAQASGQTRSSRRLLS
jgi:tape measure domain-containing protein